MKLRVWVPVSFLLAAACATTTGPHVSPEEEAAAMGELAERARFFRLEQIAKLWDMGYAIIAELPEADAQNEEPFIGFLTVDALPKEARPKGLARRDSGVVVAHVVAGSAAERAGLKRGDVVVRLNDRKIKKGSQIHEAVSKLGREAKRPVAPALRIVSPEGAGSFLEIESDVPKRYVPFLVLADDQVNAGTNGAAIGVTRGMLRFVESDDELAVVLGHELAHITRNHIGKSLGRGLGWVLFGALVSAAVGADVTGFTDFAAAIVESKYSRDQEREADYFGLGYASAAGYDVLAGVTIWERFAIELPESMVKYFFGSHPTSAERVVRARKYAEIAAGTAEDTSEWAAPADSVAAGPPETPRHWR